VKLRMPTRLRFGEGRTDREATDTRTCFGPPGYVGTARWKGDSGNRGRPVIGEGSDLNVGVGRRLRRESDRTTVPSRLGNASGGKGPDFWCASEEDEDW